MAIKLICIDMDGTLLKNEFEVHKDNIKAIKKAASKGVHVAVATGRMFSSAKHYSSIIEVDTPIIAGNGTYIKERHSDEVIAKFILGKEVLLESTKIINKYNLNYGFFCPNEIITSQKAMDKFNFDFVNQGMPEDLKVKISIYEDMNLAIEENYNNILECIIVEKENKKALESCKIELRENIKTAEIVSSWVDNVEIMKKGASKGMAVKTLAKMYNIKPEEVMCIGDNENDLSMIKYAGVGVAMGNGISLLKQNADYITTENTKGGVAKAIEKFVLNI